MLVTRNAAGGGTHGSPSTKSRWGEPAAPISSSSSPSLLQNSEPAGESMAWRRIVYKNSTAHACAGMVTASAGALGSREAERRHSGGSANRLPTVSQPCDSHSGRFLAFIILLSRFMCNHLSTIRQYEQSLPKPSSSSRSVLAACSALPPTLLMAMGRPPLSLAATTVATKVRPWRGGARLALGLLFGRAEAARRTGGQ